MKATAIVAHGGGPTAVLNASLAGIIAESRNHPEIGQLLGARHGAHGLVGEEFYDLSSMPASTLRQVEHAPGSVLGSSRRNITPDDFDRMLAMFRRREVRYLLYTGGNGSMGTARDLDAHARAAGYEMHVIGVPKTIDNDLGGTDHTPGYASCARFFAYAARDTGEDNRSLATPIMFLEVLGRNVGWVVAATSLARKHEDDPPHLIYMPENRLSADKLCADVERVYRRLGRCVVAVCEGQTDEHGTWFNADLGSAPGARDPLPANLGHMLSRIVWSRTGLRTRCERPGLVGRAASQLASTVDRDESRRCGEAAVRAATSGRSGLMVAIERLSNDPYVAAMKLVPLDEVANAERPFPREWILDGDIAPDFRTWAEPIVGEVPALPRLEWI